MKAILAIRVSLMFLFLAATSGCATKTLWDHTKGFNQPAPDPRLQVFFAEPKKDFLVMYDECYGSKGSIRRRAYFLFQNVEAKKRRVSFVSTNMVEGLAPVPIFTNTPALAQSPEFYAVVEGNAISFKLYSANSMMGTYWLPVYNDGKGKYERIALAPLAVAVDATIVGGAVAAFAAYCWAEGGGGSVPVH